MIDYQDTPAPSYQSQPKDSSAYHASAPWPIKRLLLASALHKTVKSNEDQTISTSVTAYDLTDNRLIYAKNVSEEHYAASTQKIPIVTLVLQDLRAGKITMDTQLSWATTDQRAGAGVYDAPGAPTSATVRDVIFDMLNRSGNTAIRVLVNKTLGGAAATNERLATYPQLKVTRLLPVDADRFLVGYTTARESAIIFNEFYKHKDQYTKFAKNALATNIFNDYGPRSQVQNPDIMTVIDKQGMLNDPEGNNRHDIGVIKNTKTGHEIIYTLFTTSPGDSEVLIPPAETSLKTMGRAMLVYNGDKQEKKDTQDKQAPEQRKMNTAPVEQGRTLY